MPTWQCREYKGQGGKSRCREASPTPVEIFFSRGMQGGSERGNETLIVGLVHQLPLYEWPGLVMVFPCYECPPSKER